MKTFLILLKYVLFNQLRNRWLLFYSLFYFGASFALLQFSDDALKAVASLVNVVIFFSPAVAILYSTFYWYSLDHFNRTLLMQPVQRGQVLFSNWLAVSMGLCIAFNIGFVSAFLCFGFFKMEALYLVAVGTFVHCTFCALGILCGAWFGDRMRGVSVAMSLWVYFALLHDGLVFLTLLYFREFPVEKAAFFLSLLSPIDTARLFLLTQFDFAAIMGYTGALLQKMTSHGSGFWMMAGSFLFWTVLPMALAQRVFSKSDL